jgi:hypothetical protein
MQSTSKIRTPKSQTFNKPDNFWNGLEIEWSVCSTVTIPKPDGALFHWPFLAILFLTTQKPDPKSNFQ